VGCGAMEAGELFVVLGLDLADPSGDGDFGDFLRVSAVRASAGDGAASSAGEPAACSGWEAQEGDVLVAFRNRRVSPDFVSTKVCFSACCAFSADLGRVQSC
jgi:hypothetical protein